MSKYDEATRYGPLFGHVPRYFAVPIFEVPRKSVYSLKIIKKFTFTGHYRGERGGGRREVHPFLTLDDRPPAYLFSH